MRAFLSGQRIVHLLIVAVGLCLWGYSAANNALNYTKTVAEVERVEDVCVQVGKPLETATNCLEVQADSGGKRMRRYRAVLVRYTSPADGREHRGSVIPIGGQKAVEASHLQPGTRWKILAHDDKPEDIKAE